jgi:YbgC/YbaW family acyl-CoA thioester hydrolase
MPRFTQFRGERFRRLGFVAVTTLELGRPTDRRPPFKYSALTRVWFSDTDAQGIVYYGRYLPYFDHARVEYHRHLGTAALEIGGRDFVMRANTIEYHAPARFDDLLEVFVRMSRAGRTSVTYDCAAYRIDDDVLMVTAQQVLVLVDVELRRPCPVPAELVELVRTFEGDDLEVGARS